MTTPTITANLSETPAGVPGIELRSLTRRFGRHTAVDHLDLTLSQGRTLGLIGLNGAGKSTALKMLVGLLPPTEGAAFIHGVDIWQSPIKARLGLGFVPDRPAVYPWMSVGQALRFASGFWPSWNARRCDDLLARYRLDPRRPVGSLSKGEGAKLSLMLALAHEPRVLVLDEPTDGLDVLSRDEFLAEVLGARCDSGTTIIISSHSLTDIQRMTDETAVIHEGRLLAHAPTDELVAGTKRLRAVLAPGTGTPPAPAGAVHSRLEGREWTVTVRGFARDSVERLRASAGVERVDVLDLDLDEIFRDLVRGAPKGANP